MSPNSVTLKTIYEREYQRTHYKKAVFPVFADVRFKDALKEGSTVSWEYDADATSDSLTAADAYTIAGKTTTPETLTVNQKPSHGFVIKGTQKIQDHKPTQQKWAAKAMNVIHNKIDGDVLKDLRDGAASSLDAADFGGSSGDPITVTTSNAAAIFAAAQRVLTNQNVIYDENKAFKNVVKLDGGERFPVAAIPAELKEKLLLQTGFKNTDYADQVMKSGYMGPMFGFNAISSTALPFSFRYTLTAQPTNTTYLTIGSGTTTIGSGTALKITWVTSIGSTAGNVLSETGATESVANLATHLNDIYEATTSAKHVGFTRADLSTAQKRLADNLSAVDNEDGSIVITIAGLGRQTVAQTDTAGTIDRETVHAIFGVSRSIAMVMQRSPELEVSAGNLLVTSETGGFVGKHYLCWGLYGRKVFKTHTYGLVNVKIAASAFTAPNAVIY